MRKSLALILFSVFLFNLAAFPVWFHISRYMIREDMEHEIGEHPDDSKLDILVMDKEDFDNLHWTRAHKEFEYKGNMYDVITVKSSGNKKKIYCLNDAKEKQLMVQYRTHQRTRKKSKQVLNKTEFNKYFPAEHHFFANALVSEMDYSEHVLQLVSNIISPPAPPPKPFIFS
jgi:hypothetical protein